MTLTDFLLARIAEDEAAARAVGDSGDRWYVRSIHESGDLDPLISYSEDTPRTTLARRFDPARVLAECEAKRRIIEDLRKCEYMEAVGHRTDYAQGELDAYRCAAMMLAAPYADHLDWQEAWRP